jgi:hypothetical protein
MEPTNGGVQKVQVTRDHHPMVFGSSEQRRKQTTHVPHLRGADTMTSAIDDVIHASRDPVVAVRVAQAAIASEVKV